MNRALVIVSIILLIGALFAVEKTITKPQAKVKPLVTFIELGSVSCIPCKQMKPVMAEIEKEYGDKISVVFHDVNKERQWADTYKIKLIPTQVFLDKKGKEFYRHEGFYPAAEIKKLVDKQLGIKRAEPVKAEEKK
jgi:thioredoxin 1